VEKRKEQKKLLDWNRNRPFPVDHSLGGIGGRHFRKSNRWKLIVLSKQISSTELRKVNNISVPMYSPFKAVRERL